MVLKVVEDDETRYQGERKPNLDNAFKDIKFSQKFREDYETIKKEMELEKAQREKTEKEVGKINEQELDAVPDWYEGPDGKYIKRGPKTMIKVPIKTIIPIPLVSADNVVDKDKEIDIEEDKNKEVDVDIDVNVDNDIAQEINKEKPEEYYMSEQNPYMLREEFLHKQFDKELDALKEKDNEIKGVVTKLDARICTDEKCQQDKEKETSDLFKKLQERIAILEKPRYVCRNCHEGIIAEGDRACQVCGKEIEDWSPRMGLLTGMIARS